MRSTRSCSARRASRASCAARARAPPSCWRCAICIRRCRASACWWSKTRRSKTKIRRRAFSRPRCTTILADIASEVAQTLHAMPRATPPKPQAARAAAARGGVRADPQSGSGAARAAARAPAQGRRHPPLRSAAAAHGRRRGTVARARHADRRESRPRVDDRSPRDRRAHRLAASQSRPSGRRIRRRFR